MLEWSFPEGAMLATQTPDAPVDPKYVQQVKLSTLNNSVCLASALPLKAPEIDIC